MLTNKLRWSLKLHHSVVIVTAMYYQLLLDGHADIASLRWSVFFVFICSLLFDHLFGVNQYNKTLEKQC